MDLVFSIFLLVAISGYKFMCKHEETVTSSFMDETGVIHESVVEESKLVVGNNLMLRREPRAFHKILDELGLK